MQYTKSGHGGWLFTYGSGDGAQTYEAIRNEAGFAHRAWSVWTTKVTERGIEQDQCIEDNLPTRDSTLHPALLRYRLWKAMRAAVAR